MLPKHGGKRRPRRTLVAASLAVLMLAGTATAFAVTTTPRGLLYSNKSDRSSPSSLDGAALSGTKYVFWTGTAPLSVAFYLDGSVSPVRTEILNPYDYAGTAAGGLANPLDTKSLTKGSHVITAKVKTTTNRTRTYSARFNIDNTAPTTTTTTAKPTTTTTTLPSLDQNSPLTLDPAGKRIPDTNYAIPSGAIFMAASGIDANTGTQASPVKTLNKAVALAPAGGTIVVRGGVYRDYYADGNGSYKILAKSLTFQAFPHEQAWFDGADVVPTEQWQSDGKGHWFKEWATPDFCNGGYYKYAYNAQGLDNKGPCAHYDMANAGYNTVNPAAADPQMAFIDGVALAEVTTLDQVAAGKFFYAQDLVNKTGKIYIATSPSGHTVELAKRPKALVAGGSGMTYTVRGLGFRRYATNEADGISAAVYLSGAVKNVVENSAFTDMAAGGLYVSSRGGVVSHSILARNGIGGMGSNGHSGSDGLTDGLVIENSLISGNNSEQFGFGCTASCGQAGIKIAHMVGFTVRNNIFENNKNAAGFWCDLDCSHGVIINNLVRNNGTGIFYEVSDTGIIASNVVVNHSQYGINVGSANTKVYNNTVIDSAIIDIRIYDDSRYPAADSDSGPDTANIDIKNNVVSSKAVNTVWLVRSNSNGTNTGPNTFISGLDYNSYYRQLGPDKVLFRWIDGTDQSYKSAASFTTAHGFESHAQDISSGTDPFFVNQAGGNYSIRSSSAAYNSGTALPADVAAALGVSTTAGKSRGAINWPTK